MELIIVLTTFIFYFKASEILYIYQTKEYRFDRFLSFIKEKGWWQLIYLSSTVRHPAFSWRNLLIFILIFSQLVFVLLALSMTKGILLILYILSIPLISFFTVSIGVAVTAIPVALYRQLIINKAKQKIRNINPICIGVTGSYGKTSVKEYLFALLSQKYCVAKTEKNQNTEVGIALSILHNLKPMTKYFIVEFGAYKRGEIVRETELVKPTYSILTGLGNQHLDLYKTKKNLIAEETYILNLNTNKIAYLNLDFSGSKTIFLKIKTPIITYSIHQPTADISAEIIERMPNYTIAKVRYRQRQLTISVKLPGDHSLLNLLPCIALALDVGIKEDEIIKTISKLSPLEGKLSLHKGAKGSLIINDSYSSNLAGFIAAVDYLSRQPYAKKIIVTQGIIELGVEKRASYETILNEIKKTNCKLFTNDKLFAKINNEGDIFIFNDVKKMLQQIMQLLDNQTAILIEGRFSQGFIASLLKN